MLTITSRRPPRAKPSLTPCDGLANEVRRFFRYSLLALSAVTPLPTDLNTLDPAPVTPPKTHNRLVSELIGITFKPSATSSGLSQLGSLQLIFYAEYLH